MADGWVVDKSLDAMLAQINAAAPGRDKSSDGSIGDPDHQTRESAHNPEDSGDADAPGNPDEQVDARDFTNDPAANADMAVVTEALRKSKDKRLKLVIFNRRQFSNYWRDGIAPYTWRPYYGSNPHDKHAHVEVNDVYHDQTSPPWQIGIDMGLTADESAELLGGKLTPRNILHWRLRGIQDSDDPELKTKYPKLTVPAPGLKQLDARLTKVEQQPPVVSAPIEQAALDAAVEAALTKMLPAIAKAVADEDHARSAG